MKNMKIKTQRNIVVVGIMIYVTAFIMSLEYLGYIRYNEYRRELEKLSGMIVSIPSVNEIVEIVSIISSLILIEIAIIPSTLMLARDISIYCKCEHRKCLYDG